MPLLVGGGIKTKEDIKVLLRAGADKVSINTSAVSNPELISEGAETFGSQCIVVAIDAKMRKEGWEVYIYGGKKPTGLDAVEWAKKVESLGAGEILLTSMDRDGTMDGFDIELTKAVSSSVNIPVIASGGVGKPEHFFEGFTYGRADACLAASIFHFRIYSIVQIKNYLKEKGIMVRL